MYRILLIIIKSIGIIPINRLYIISDVLFFIFYRIYRYRKNTVKNNLKNSYPHYSIKELKKIEHKFYRSFFDILTENLLLH